MWSNFHTHSHYCDGKGTMRDYLEAAKVAGVATIGFSSHAPLPFACKWSMKDGAFSEYLREIESARSSFPELEVRAGLEVDFIPGIVSPLDFASRLDYTIGSIHFVGSFEGKHWEIDNTLEVFKEGLHNIFKDNVQSAVTRYYELTREMLSKTPPDILGHLDKIKINAQNTGLNESDPWYILEVNKTLELIRQTNTIVEVNTRGIYKKKSTATYPSTWILERICDLEIPITLSSDAHHPGELIREFDATLTLLKAIGFKNLSVPEKGTWKQITLNEYGPGQ